MTHFPDDDEQLIAFLKEYHPIAPPAKADLEMQLMELVTREPPPIKHSHQFFWIISSAMAGSLVLAIGGYRFFSSTPKFAANPEELETFLVDNWNSSVEEIPVIDPMYTAQGNWLMLSEPETRYVVSHP
ncbi:hypothetical protein HC931_21235 [Candidatus Gracilibacteria bacterium]|jgi:hypothetical protein|nr:hypothetical protein [Candidatus Gracilibacteria bacterium]NJM89971.1 hypothetical protein [Hydrococcus sp. RU_2_2]NJP20359.1 hypothetical protein [Hydrococcus sp. CRU_1_1]NJQ98458.1 hypothetical protein [Hydrococcus sp. CSU_1_8]